MNSQSPARPGRSATNAEVALAGVSAAPYYQDEHTTVYNADALDILPCLTSGSIDLCVTDPPYIIGAVSTGSMRSKSGSWSDMMNSALWFTEWYRMVADALADDGAMWSFLNWKTLPVTTKAAMTAGLPLTSMMVWDKETIGPGGPSGLRPSYEMCALMAGPEFRIPNRSTSDIWRFKTSTRKPNGHPAEKPVGLVEQIIKASEVREGGTILDPFVGSGTTAVAARRAGLRSVVIEAEERYCEVVARRMEVWGAADSLCVAA